MSNLAIKVENLSKKYTISHERERGDDNFREAIIGTTKKIITSLNPFSQTSACKDTTKEEFLALNNISFEVNQGDKVGIIGRNGAGKSTLLKVLSRITEPTSGKIHINGRIASLLEVGTGFHPELTGRENIYLNGAILGMSRAEIKKKFDEIVAFAEVEKFLDTPVKRYSSGMYVRLAFAVAAHLEPEILVVDEVLAVGDVEFQKKCLGKMSEVSKEGRTILFVSHNMHAIKQLCNKCVYLKSGKVIEIGYTQKILDLYMSKKNNLQYDFPIQSDELIIKNFLITQESLEVEDIDGGKPISIDIDFKLLDNVTNFRIGIYLKSLTNQVILRSFIADWDANLETMNKGEYTISLSIPESLINKGIYTVELHASRYGRKNYFSTNNTITKEITISLPSLYNSAHSTEEFESSIILKEQWIIKNDCKKNI